MIDPLAPTDPLLAAVLAWARRQATVRVVLLTGSRAQPAATPDALSDFDVELYVDGDPAIYADDGWLPEIAPVLVSVGDAWEGDPTRLVFFEGGRKADFLIRRLDALDALTEQLDELHERGFVVLLDRDGRAAGLPAPSGRPRRAVPTAMQLADAAREFWFEAAHVPRYLARGELWPAQTRLANARGELLRLIELHAQATSGAAASDVRHLGTALARWAAPWITQRLAATFAGYAREETFQALQAATALFSRVCAETAHAAGVPAPIEIERAMRPLTAAIPDMSGGP
ncbi:aminoglycoside 6-adenylyltransferase [Conexibacter woesei]|uniref:Adenylyltransferase n=1 Tax=Conexibacter woesei (strain DSM 14684 / CCUG 47730 / CIP 108061 / JCM 11494 / NBRC 100937 / ID131577) TaxID=469383 RepID=D3FF72_CONWI|nr:aminoglycoside 6-adenylyltransferase [Conexibacter woesei]ADB51789.1 conserved hypothetical protein [Conexibacter woesei DSM 14684]